MTEELFRADAYLKRCEARIVGIDADGIRLDRTVFYANSGGQPGDTGRLIRADGAAVSVVDTKKGALPGEILHVPAPDGPALAEGEAVTAEIDWDRRHKLMRMHTLLHLISARFAGQITGAAVGEGKGRIDLNLGENIPDKEELTQALNRWIAEDRPVTIKWISDEELAANPDLVRTMSVKPPTGTGKVRLVEVEGVDLQPCGGTHVARIGEIGPVQVTKIENKGKHNRRINVALVE